MKTESQSMIASASWWGIASPLFLVVRLRPLQLPKSQSDLSILASPLNLWLPSEICEGLCDQVAYYELLWTRLAFGISRFRRLSFSIMCFRQLTFSINRFRVLTWLIARSKSGGKFRSVVP